MVISTYSILSGLVEKYNIRHQRVILSQQSNPYEGKIPQNVVVDKPLKFSELGTPVFSNITFKGGQYTDHLTGKVYTFEDITMDTVLLNVSQAKRIVRTEIEGRNGSVKEYIGLDDYQVQVNAILTGGNGHYPVERVLPLKRMLDAPVPIDVVCSYLKNLGIYTLVVTGYTIDQEAGGYSQQNVSIQCISDTPIILQRVTGL